MALIAIMVVGLITPGAAQAIQPANTETPAAPPSGQGIAVSLGDSYISGEAGRWAGNSSSTAQVDALGRSAYWDAGNRESTPRCHRASSAEIFYAGPGSAVNLACSGSRVNTRTDSSGNFKPGLDFYNDGRGNIGQVLALQELAGQRRVNTIAVQIGGNDFNFGSIVSNCVTKFLTSSSWAPRYCKDDPSVQGNFTRANISSVTEGIATGLRNIRTAMTNAGYASGDYRIIVQNYPQPLPTSDRMAYGQFGYSRQSTYGCGFWNADLDWAAKSALPQINNAVRNGYQAAGLTNASFLDISGLFAGKELCAQGTKKLNDTSLASWRSPGASDVSEWISEIRTVSTAYSEYYIQESLHPNYWGQLALRGCLRQAAGTASDSRCLPAGNGLTPAGEPRVRLG